jgi:hypothetical protein
MQRRDAPAWIAVVNSRRSVSGSDRVVSSVTYITVNPCRTAKPTASSVHRLQVIHGPVLRIAANGARADEAAAFDRNTGALQSTSAIGWMSPITVRAAQLARMRNRESRNSVASRSTSRHDVRPGSGQSDVGRVDPDAIEQVEDVQLLLDRGRTRPTETAARRATSRRRA